jgi:acyl carrier protein
MVARSPDTLQVVRDVLVEVTDDPAMAGAERLQVDSLQALRILIELENRLEVEIDEVAMFSEGWFETPEGIVEYLDRLRAERST